MMQRQKIYHKVRIQQFHLLDHGYHQLHLDHQYQRQSLWHHFLYEPVQIDVCRLGRSRPHFPLFGFFSSRFSARCSQSCIEDA